MSRLHAVKPDQMNQAQRELYDTIAGGDRAKDASFRLLEEDKSLVGPFNALLYSPAVGDAVQSLGSTLRFESSTPSNIREIAILTVAKKYDSDFEWWAHEPIALKAGLSREILDAIRCGGNVSFPENSDQLTYDLCRQLLDSGKLSEEIYAAAIQEFNESGIFEIIVIVGYYVLLAQLMNAFEVGVPTGETPIFSAPPARHDS